MIKKIKTKDAMKGTIKQLNRAAIASDRMRRAYIQTKDKVEYSASAAESTPEEYASDQMHSGVQNITYEAERQAKILSQKELQKVRGRLSQSKDNTHSDPQTFDSQRQQLRKAAQRERIKTGEREMREARHDRETFSDERQSVAAVEQGRKRVIQNTQKQSVETAARACFREGQLARSVASAERQIKGEENPGSKKTIKTVEKTTAKSVKTEKRLVKTSERTAKNAIKTSNEAGKVGEMSAQAAAKEAQKVAQAARETAKSATARVKASAKAVAATLKGIISASKSLIASLAVGSSVAGLVVVIIMLVALIACSVFGIFFSGEDSGTGMTMRTVVREINEDYDNRLEAEKASVAYDMLEMSGSRAVWKEVLAVYAVKVNTDPDDPLEVATVDDIKKRLLSDIFWEMNEISSHSETESETVVTETDDGEGNIIGTESTVTTTTLYIVVSHKTADEMAEQYGFNQEQKDYLAELLRDENNSLWAAVLYGIAYSDDQIVTVALSQVGNDGGTPYWSWYGFSSRVEWCACFVSWCANECGYIDNGMIPKYAGCVWGVQWFKDREQWIDNSAEPAPGMIIFFDWDNRGSSGPQDGQSDHTGIVQKVENGVVYTVEGNSGDSVRCNSYPVGHYEILGYGVPQY